MSDSADRLPGLHALRALAAVSVFVLHEVFLVAGWIKPVTEVVDTYFALGVQLFYVVSAFALMYSTRAYETAPDWLSRFYLKRFWRIAPLFYVMVLFTTIYAYATSHQSTTTLEVLANLFFVNNLVPRWAGSLAFAGWSVSVEVLFYVVFPLAFAFIRSLRSALVLVVVTIIVSEGARYFFDQIRMPFIGTYGDFSVVVNLQYFAYGILGYLAFERLQRARQEGNKLLNASLLMHAAFLAISAGTIALISHYNAPLRAFHRIDMTIWGAVFALWAVWASLTPPAWLSWEPFQFLGERSYSLYLLHTIVLVQMKPVTVWIFDSLQPSLGSWALAIALLVTYAPVVILATFTYALIEKPGMDIGRRLRSRMRRGSSSSQMTANSSAR